MLQTKAMTILRALEPMLQTSAHDNHRNRRSGSVIDESNSHRLLSDLHR